MLDILQSCVQTGEKLGADFVEARFDDLTLRTLERTDDTWKEIQGKSRMGTGITCYVDGVSGFSFTASPEKKDILIATEKAYKMAKASSKAAKLKLPFDNRSAVNSKSSDTFSVKTHPKKEDFAFKVDLVNRAVEAAKEYGKNIRNIRGMYGELHGPKIFTNSDGSIVNWDFLVVDIRCIITSKTDAGALVVGRETHGGTYGLETYNGGGNSPEDLGERAGKRVTEQLKAKACPAGKFRALCEERLIGVLAHESFGHLSEGDFIVTGGSPLSGKIGTKLGTEDATIIDGGLVDIKKHGGLWLPYDDQGIPTGMTTVLEKGILKHYLHNRGTAQNLGQEPTGNARAVQFVFPPIPRMTNTYFAPGDLSEDEAIELLDTGVYAIQSSGGQVEGDGSFLFKAIRGYWVEKGEIKYPLREVSLSGNILELLGHVLGGTKNLKITS